MFSLVADFQVPKHIIVPINFPMVYSLCSKQKSSSTYELHDTKVKLKKIRGATFLSPEIIWCISISSCYCLVRAIKFNCERPPAPDDLKNKMEGKNKPGGIEIYKHGGNEGLKFSGILVINNVLRKRPFEILENIMLLSLDDIFPHYLGRWCHPHPPLLSTILHSTDSEKFTLLRILISKWSLVTCVPLIQDKLARWHRCHSVQITKKKIGTGLEVSTQHTGKWGQGELSRSTIGARDSSSTLFWHGIIFFFSPDPE